VLLRAGLFLCAKSFGMGIVCRTALGWSRASSPAIKNSLLALATAVPRRLKPTLLMDAVNAGLEALLHSKTSALIAGLKALLRPGLQQRFVVWWLQA
jgi:hypothetical protein